MLLNIATDLLVQNVGRSCKAKREPHPRDPQTGKIVRPRTFSVLPPALGYTSFLYEYRPTPLIHFEEAQTDKTYRQLKARLRAILNVVREPASHLKRLARLLQKQSPLSIHLRYLGAGYALPQSASQSVLLALPPARLDSS